MVTSSLITELQCLFLHNRLTTIKTLLQASASNYFDENFGQFYLAKFESYLVVRLLFKGGF